MALIGVDGIGTNDIGAKLLQVWNITLAVGVIRQRVGVIGVARAGAIRGVLLLIGDTADEEFGAVVGVKEFVTL